MFNANVDLVLHSISMLCVLCVYGTRTASFDIIVFSFLHFNLLKRSIVEFGYSPLVQCFLHNNELLRVITGPSMSVDSVFSILTCSSPRTM